MGRRKVALGVVLVVLLLGMLAAVCDAPTRDANTAIRRRHNELAENLDFAESMQDRPVQQSIFHETGLTDANWASARFWPEAQDRFSSTYGFDVRGPRVFQSGFAPTHDELFDRAELQGFSNAGQDSIELVIGIDKAKQNGEIRIEDYLRENGGRLVDSISMGVQTQAVVADVPLSSEFSFISAVETAGLTTFIEPNIRFEADSVPNDPDWHMQWAPTKIGADYAWNMTVGNHSVLVAVVDTGVDWNHPDLAANYVSLGYDWVNLDANPMDDYGHGTHVAGIIAAVLNNGIGIAGLAQVRIMAEKVLDETGSGSENQAAQGIVHAVDQGADIINLSFGSSHDSRLMHEAVRYAYEHGVLVVAAAGNEGSDAKHYPAAYDEVVAVTATDENDKPAYFTTFGDWVEIAAPGVDIYSTIWDDSYAPLSGTSMAAPHAVGIAALILSEYPSMTRDQVWAQLQCSADDLGEPGFDIYYGFGRVNAEKAVEQAPSDHDLLVLKMDTPSYLRPGTVAVINTTILNMGTSPESNIIAQLLVNGSVAASTVIDFLVSGASTHVSFSLNATAEGVYNVTSYVMPLAGETVVGNNALSMHTEVRAPHVFRVPDQYGSIQKAIDAAEKGDTVFVASGTYDENLWINKEDLNLTGEDQQNTIIDGQQAADVIFVYTSNKITISRLTVRNSRRVFSYSGIFVLGANEITISEVTMSNNYHGLYLILTTGVTLRNNNMTQNKYNFGVDGGSLDNFVHDIDVTNTVNGKPMYYLVNAHDRQIPSDAGYVAVINSTGILTKDLDLEKNLDGMLLAYSTECSVQNVSVSNNDGGIRLYQSSNNKLYNNTVNMNELGMYLSYSGNNSLTDNHMIANTFNFGVGGDSILSFIQEIDTSNTVEAKAIYYLVNEDDKGVPPNAGYVAAVNSTNITIENSNISHNWQGILLAYTNQSQIINTELSNNYNSIYLWHSDRNIIDDNKISNGTWDGIGAYFSHSNTIMNNTVGQAWLGIDLDRSSNNTLHSNTATDNGIGIIAHRSKGNLIDSNVVLRYARGIELWYSDNSVVINNNASGGAMSFAGIWLTEAQHNVIEGNSVTYCSFWIGAGIYLYHSSNNNIIVGNTLAYNWYGIILGARDTHIYVDRNNDNTIHHNNFIHNYIMQVSSWDSINTWDDGYPSGGNYWNGYGQDSRSGPYQNLTGSDGISDAPFVIDGQNRDRYPYMKQIIGPQIAGDLNHDGKVDIVDLALAATTFGTYAGHPRWNTLTDVNKDGKSDIKDLVLVAKNFGKTSR